MKRVLPRVFPYVYLFAILGMVACHHVPPSLTPAGAIVWKANEVGHVIQTLQTVAIGLNDAHAAGATDANTRIVVDAVATGFPILQKTPDGWRATGTAILEQVRARLDTNGKQQLSPYLALVEAALQLARDLPGPLPTDDQMRAVFADTIRHGLADGQRWSTAHPRP